MTSILTRSVEIFLLCTLLGCAADREVVYFDVPSHALGRIVYRAANSKSRKDLSQAYEEMVQFQDTHLTYLPDYVSRVIHALTYMLDHNTDPSQFQLVSSSVRPENPMSSLVAMTSRPTQSKPSEVLGLRKSPEPPSPTPASPKSNGASLAAPVKDTQIPRTAKSSSSQPSSSLNASTSSPLETLTSHFISKISGFSKNGSNGVTIAVHPFRITDSTNPQGLRETSSVLESEIERALMGTENVKIVTRRNLRDMQAEKRLGESDLSSPSDSRTKYAMLEADLIIRGQATISNNRKDLALICELIDPASGVLLASKQLLIEPRGGGVEYFVKK